ncbi:MAG: Gfo/Idh/MocA family oxidoreductase [Sulfitobacter sp.]|nr:Gfo/Idh/MocA family oxidoreductase [Sulfitobacter sp.]
MRSLAVVGCGRGGSHALRAATQLPDVEVVAVADPDTTALANARSLHPNADQFRNIDALLASTKIDIVCIATPPPTHVGVTTAALDRGVRGLLLEKPVSHAYYPAAELVERIKAAGAHVEVPHGLLVLPHSASLAEALTEGAIGRIERVLIRCDSWDLLNAGIHWINYALNVLTPDRITVAMAGADVSAHTHRDAVKVETEAITTFVTESGVSITIHTGNDIGRTSGSAPTTIDFIGSEGIATFWGWERRYTIRSRHINREVIFPEPVLNRHALFLDRLVRSMEAEHSDYRSLDLSLDALEAVDAAYASARTGAKVHLGREHAEVDKSMWTIGEPYLGESESLDGKSVSL